MCPSALYLLGAAAPETCIEHFLCAAILQNLLRRKFITVRVACVLEKYVSTVFLYIFVAQFVMRSVFCKVEFLFS